MNKKLEDFQKCIDYSFNDIELLRTALTHSSFAKTAGQDKKVHDNERLEFLGDAVLGLCVGEQIFRTYSGISEGVMSRTRANAVCEEALYEAAKNMGLPDMMLLSYGEVMSGGKDKPSILSDALEAVIGAIYLDGGLEAARKFVLSFTDVQSAYKASRKKDSKTRLQEFVQERHMGQVDYVVVAVDGPDHRHTFTIDVRLNGAVLGTGRGMSKHEAGKAAAEMALSNLENKK